MKYFNINRGNDFDDVIILTEVVRRPSDPRTGMSIDEVRRSVRVLDNLESLESTADSVSFEDADYDFLINKLNDFKFALADKRIVDLIDRATNPKTSDK